MTFVLWVILPHPWPDLRVDRLGLLDTFAAAFATLALWLALRIRDKPVRRDVIFLGIALGCAAASKATGLLAIVPVVVLLWPHLRPLLLALVIAPLVFLATYLPLRTNPFDAIRFMWDEQREPLPDRLPAGGRRARLPAPAVVVGGVVRLGGRPARAGRDAGARGARVPAGGAPRGLGAGRRRRAADARGDDARPLLRALRLHLGAGADAPRRHRRDAPPRPAGDGDPARRGRDLAVRDRHAGTRRLRARRRCAAKDGRPHDLRGGRADQPRRRTSARACC